MTPKECFLRLIFSLISSNYSELGLERSTSVLMSSYDFIVIGGGTAGSVVASRMTENPSVSVLLLESGGSGSDATDAPLLSSLVHRSEITRVYRTVRQNYACGLGSCEAIVGHVLGGASVHNAMGFVRGNKLDFDEWAANGAKGWTFDEVLPFFKKLERVSNDFGSNRFRGRTGPVQVIMNYREKNPFSNITNIWLAAAKEAGHQTSGDYNGERQELFSPLQTNMRNGRRETADNSYIKPIIAKRPNLHILMLAHVTKIVFSGTKAIGVEYERFKRTFRVLATKEVILSAGAIQSPQVLMLSGVGPRTQLANFKIPLIAHLPGVGENFQDHPAIILTIATNATINASNFFNRKSFCRWNRTGQGLYQFRTNIGIGFMKSTRSSKTVPDDTQTRPWMSVRLLDLPRVLLSVAVEILKPTSKGSIKLNSSSPYGDPLIDPRYMSSREDQQNMFEGVKDTLKILYTRPFRQIDARIANPIVQRCKGSKPWSDEYIRCIVASEAVFDKHLCCSCRIGTDSLAVVDPRLRVRNVQNLRVVDASVMPSVPRGNTMAPTLMIGEKAAQMIKKDWKLS